MGERKNGVESDSPEALEQEILRFRESIDPVARELDMRRHRMTDWRRQMKHRAPKVASILGTVLGVLAAAKAVRRRLKQRRAMTRVRAAIMP